MTSQQIYNTVDEIIGLVEMQSKRTDKACRNGVRLEEFRDVDVSYRLGDEDDYFFLAGEDCNPDVIWPINHTTGVHRDDGGWRISEMKTIHPSEVRGVARIVSPRMLKRRVTVIKGDGSAIRDEEILVYLNGSWTRGESRSQKLQYRGLGVQTSQSWQANSDEKRRVNALGQTAIGHALRQYYEWSVTIQDNCGLSVRLATDVEGIKALLKERDKGENGRRSALRAWITDHWRQMRSDPDQEVYVRRHLRGAQGFSWRGYKCQWRPAEFDVLQNARLADERSVMGKQARRTRWAA